MSTSLRILCLTAAAAGGGASLPETDFLKIMSINSRTCHIIVTLHLTSQDYFHGRPDGRWGNSDFPLAFRCHPRILGGGNCFALSVTGRSMPAKVRGLKKQSQIRKKNAKIFFPSNFFKVPTSSNRPFPPPPSTPTRVKVTGIRAAKRSSSGRRRLSPPPRVLPSPGAAPNGLMGPRRRPTHDAMCGKYGRIFYSRKSASR